MILNERHIHQLMNIIGLLLITTIYIYTSVRENSVYHTEIYQVYKYEEYFKYEINTIIEPNVLDSKEDACFYKDNCAICHDVCVSFDAAGGCCFNSTCCCYVKGMNCSDTMCNLSVCTNQ